MTILDLCALCSQKVIKEPARLMHKLTEEQEQMLQLNDRHVITTAITLKHIVQTTT